jgi:hypothetical protein
MAGLGPGRHGPFTGYSYVLSPIWGDVEVIISNHLFLNYYY